MNIEIETYVHTSGGEGCSTTYTIGLGSSNHFWETVWEFVVPRDYSVHQSFNHSFSPDWLQGGDHMGIMFRINAISDDLGSNYLWEIGNLKITVYGSALTLDQSTWGGIKASL